MISITAKTALTTATARRRTAATSYSVRLRSSSSSSPDNSSSSAPSDDDSNDKKKNYRKKFRNALDRVVRRMRIVRATLDPSSLRARFRALSAKAKRVVVVQLLLFAFAFGSVARVAVTTSGRGGGGGGGIAAASRRPVEISYSSFLDLVEQQQNRAAGIGKSSSSSSPVVDRVRIGNDRIVFRLYRNADDQQREQQQLATAGAAQPKKRLLPGLPLSRSPKSEATAAEAAVAAKQRVQRPRPYLTAYTKKVSASPELLELLRKNDIPFAAAPSSASTLVFAGRSFFVTFYFLILWRLYKTVSGAAGTDSSKDAPGKLAQTSDLPMASFDEIQGIDDAKMEVMELVDALRFPDKYAVLGARAPTGLLLEGPPGTGTLVPLISNCQCLQYIFRIYITVSSCPSLPSLTYTFVSFLGKTMLARATAATAGVPLLYCSGSDFVEMFVGRGAARVRKLFERAEKLAPCIIFIDELDALGKSRDMGGPGSAFSRSNDEAEQTLNQLLACMDGLDSSRRICVLAATNRKAVLDQALIRPGRFDRIVKLRLPDAKGRERILRVHCKKLPGFQEGSGVDPNRPGALGTGRVVDLSAIAGRHKLLCDSFITLVSLFSPRPLLDFLNFAAWFLAVTDGFSGAELEFLVNEAAIRAVRRVSAALRAGVHGSDITPHVEAADFEASLASFYETRRPNSGVAEIWKKVWR